MQTTRQKVIFIAIFVVLFFAVRVHFYKFPLSGEEGMFAEIFVNQPQGSEFMLQGRADGENIYNNRAHPYNLYNSLRIAGFLCSPITKQIPYTDDLRITPLLRVLFSMFQFFILLGIGLYLCFRKEAVNILLALLFLAIAISPTAIKTSIILQIDGGVGILMNGLFAAIILLIARSKKRTFLHYALLFCATFYLATGKQEWSIILLFAFIVIGIFALITRSVNRQDFKPDIPIVLTIFAGVITGNIISYFLGPINYMGSLDVIWQFSRIESAISGDTQIADWVQLRLSKIFWICTVIALAAISSILAFQKIKKIRLPELLLCIYGLGLFGAFFFSNASLVPRHFAPSLIVLTFAVIALFPSKMSPKTFTVISLILFTMYASTVVHVFVSTFMKPIRPHFDASTVNLKPDEIAILSPAQGWNKPEIDFINHYMGKTSVEKTAKKLNKKLYPQDYVWPENETRKDY